MFADYKNMQTEKWLDITDYESLYAVSNLGNVIYKPTNTHKKQRSRNGYKFIRLHRKGIKKFLAVHRLVAKTFIPNPLNKPHVNHINGVKYDNRVENLEWVTSGENTRHAILTGLKRKRIPIKLTVEIVTKIRAEYVKGVVGVPRLAKKYLISESMVNHIVNNRRWKNI